MRNVLREGSEQYHFQHASAADDEHPKLAFNDQASAVAFLQRFKHDVSQMAAMRNLLPARHFDHGLSRLDDEEVIIAFASELVRKEYIVGLLHPPSQYAAPTVAPAPPVPPKPKPKPQPPPTRKTAKLKVKVVRADHKAIARPATVEIQGPSPGTKPTNASGVAEFSGLAVGDYTVTVKLSDADQALKLQDSSYEPGTGHGIALGPNDDGLLVATLLPPGSLEVIVLGSLDDAFLANVKVAADGPTKKDASSQASNGCALLSDLKEGAYKLSLTVPDTLSDVYGEPLQKPEANITHGQHAKLVVKLPARPEPTIKIDDPKIVLVKRSYQDRPELNVKPHRIPVKLGVIGAFDGTGELRSAAASTIRVFDSQAATNELALPLALTADQLKKGHELFVEGKNPSASVGGTELVVEISGGALLPKTPTASEKITCVRLTLEVHKSRPEGGGEPAVISEADKITPGRHVVEQGSTDDRLFAERALVVLKKAEPNAFTGQLLLKPLSANVEVFADAEEVPAAGQTPLTEAQRTIANDTIDAAKGARFWVQGKTKSGAMGDTGLFVGVASIKDSEGDRVTMTVLKLELRVHQSRKDVAATGDPDPIADGDKMSTGRFVHVQFGSHHGRALMIVRKVEPAGFVGKLTLTAFKATQKPAYSASKTATSHLELFDAETGGSAVALGEIDHPAGFPADGKRIWVQGKTVSGELRDSELRLGVKEVDKGADRGAFTVVRFKNLKADIPSTPPNTQRATRTGGGNNFPVNRHPLEIGHPPAAKDFDEDYATNAPLVLVEGSVLASDTINISVEVEPADVPVLWGSVRDRRAGKGDHADIIALAGNSDDPGLTQDGGNPLKATLTANAVGSFHICPYVDGNGNSKFDFSADDGTRIDREPYMMMNLVLIRVQGVSNLSTANSLAGRGFVTVTRNVRAPNPPFGRVPVPTSFNTGDFLNTGNDAVRMIAIARVIGGGQNGKRGLDALFCGWLNNEVDCATSPSGGLSEDVTHFHQNSAPGSPVLRLRCFWQLNGALVGGPVLDSGYAGQGTGGQTCTGTEGHNGPNRLTKTDHPSGIGQTWREENVDSPGGGIDAFHPRDPLAWLNRFTFNIDFQCALLFWTNMGKVANATNRPAVRLYSSVQSNTWNIRFEVTFTAGFAATIVTAKTVTFNADADPTRLATPVDGSGLETRLPDGLTLLQTNQNF